MGQKVSRDPATSLPRIVILMGVCGAGKSTIGRLLADDWGWPFFEGDDFHSPKNIAKMSRGFSLSEEDRLPWLQGLASLIDELLAHSKSAVISCSALKQSHRDRLTKHSPHVSMVYLQGTYETIRRRLRSRLEHFMPLELLDSQLEELEEPVDIPVVNIDQTPDLIVKQIKQALHGHA